MCAAKGFDAVELDDIDSFDPPSTTGFHLTPGDAQNYLAYAFNVIHRYGMTGLWKNSPLLSWWGRRYADGAVVEECYRYHQCFAAQLRGSSQYGITCTGLAGRDAVRLGRLHHRHAPRRSPPASGSARPSTARITTSATRGRRARPQTALRHVLPDRVRAAVRLRGGQVRREPERQDVLPLPPRHLTDRPGPGLRSARKAARAWAECIQPGD